MFPLILQLGGVLNRQLEIILLDGHNGRRLYGTRSSQLTIHQQVAGVGFGCIEDNKVRNRTPVVSGLLEVNGLLVGNETIRWCAQSSQLNTSIACIRSRLRYVLAVQIRSSRTQTEVILCRNCRLLFTAENVARDEVQEILSIRKNSPFLNNSFVNVLRYVQYTLIRDVNVAVITLNGNLINVFADHVDCVGWLQLHAKNVVRRVNWALGDRHDFAEQGKGAVEVFYNREMPDAATHAQRPAIVFKVRVKRKFLCRAAYK